MIIILIYLYIVGEARKLPKELTGSSTSSYCIIDLKDKQVRTQTIWSTREPMWMEEFYLYNIIYNILSIIIINI